MTAWSSYLTEMKSGRKVDRMIFPDLARKANSSGGVFNGFQRKSLLGRTGGNLSVVFCRIQFFQKHDGGGAHPGTVVMSGQFQPLFCPLGRLGNSPSRVNLFKRFFSSQADAIFFVGQRNNE